MQDCLLVKLALGQQVTEAFSKNFGLNRFVHISDMENLDDEEVNCYNNFLEVFKTNLYIF